MRLLEPLTKLLWEFMILFDPPPNRVFPLPVTMFLWLFLNLLPFPITEFMWECIKALSIPPIIFAWEFSRRLPIPSISFKLESLRRFLCPNTVFLLEWLKALPLPMRWLKWELRRRLSCPKMTLLGIIAVKARPRRVRHRISFIFLRIISKNGIFWGYLRCYLHPNSGICPFSILIHSPFPSQKIIKTPQNKYNPNPSKKSQLNQQLPSSQIDDNKMHKKQIPTRTTILEQHVQAELTRQQTLSNYYQQILSGTRQRKNKLELMDGNDIAVSVKNSSPHKKDNRNQSFMGKSNLSFVIQTPKNPKDRKNVSHVGQPPTYGKGQPITFEAQYQSCVDSLSKTLASIAEKQHGTQNRKDFQKTSKTSSIMLGKTSKLARSALPKKTNLQSIKLKTDSSCPQPTKKQKILLDIGDLSSLTCEDEIINNLINNIKIEEERYVDLVLRSTETNVRQKMRNYIARQTEKYEEMLFKAKQEEAEKLLSSLKSNKETVKCGYTERMREVVDRGLRSTGFNPH